jgi:hypothetical protein
MLWRKNIHKQLDQNKHRDGCAHFFNLQQLHSHSLSAAAALSGVSSEIVEHEAPDGSQCLVTSIKESRFATKILAAYLADNFGTPQCQLCAIISNAATRSQDFPKQAQTTRRSGRPRGAVCDEAQQRRPPRDTDRHGARPPDRCGASVVQPTSTGYLTVCTQLHHFLS